MERFGDVYLASFMMLYMGGYISGLMEWKTDDQIASLMSGMEESI
jgi:hypothetical protein